MGNMKEIYIAAENECIACDKPRTECDGCILTLNIRGQMVTYDVKGRTVIGELGRKRRVKDKVKSPQTIVAIVNNELSAIISVDKWDKMVDNIDGLNVDEKKYAKFNVGVKAYRAE